LNGKYGGNDLLLGATVCHGHYSREHDRSSEKKGILLQAIDKKLGGLFDPLLDIDLFKFSPFGVKGDISTLLKSPLVEAFTAGGDLVSSKLMLKIGGLAAGLGILDATAGAKGDLFSTVLDTAESIIGDQILALFF